MDDKDRQRWEDIMVVVDGVTALHDPQEDGHEIRCHKMALMLAYRLGLSAEEIEVAGIAGHLHDTGKVGIPETVLSKPVLSDAEMDMMRGHPLNGKIVFDKLKNLTGLEEVKKAIESHQENWDGSGYPRGLKGDDIPIIAQDLRIVDCYDALTHDRVYRGKMTHEDAILLMETKNGLWFSPRVFAVFKAMKPDEVADEKIEDE